MKMAPRSALYKSRLSAPGSPIPAAARFGCLLRSTAAFFVAASLLGATGCAGVEVAANVKQVRSMIKEARENGAYRCAPRELALAETNADFTESELDQGDYFRAREHLEIADRNAREAYRLSPRGRCLGQAAPVAVIGDKDRDGIKDDVDKCPSDAEDKDGFEDEDGCPDPDNDKDGIPDLKDKCPNDAEDKDGFEDEDGCPDLDNDKDGILDASDKCPNDAEDKDGFEDEDGCPDLDNDKDGIPDTADKCPNDAGPADNNGCPKKYEHIVVTEAKIELKQKIFFETNKAVIRPRSFPLLAEIGQVLAARPTMTVRIEGHTDSQGKRARNMTLSQSRADSVRQFLIGLGVEASRLESKGFGPDQPIETNKTAAGREKNRRVEFFITQQ
ncbi:MAG TPA: OmpA family protein [Polyangia bacterium]|jgi:outer membrane protein OmpA-like peptidoglycan-associated protein|nr:OmpA family protein [Polyangia bacterium]